MLGAGSVVWYVLLGPTAVSGAQNNLQLAFSLAYPVGDLVLIFGVTTLVLRGVDRASRRPLDLFCIGLVFFVAADLVYGHLALENAYQGGDRVDGLWMIAMTIWVVSANAQRRARSRREIAAPADEAVREHSFLPYVAVAVSFGLLVSSLASANGFTLGVVALVDAVTVLVLIRLQWLFLENRRQGRYFRALVENVSDNILTINRDRVVTYMSPSMERLLGHDATTAGAKAAGRTIVAPEERLQGLTGALEELGRHPGESISIELQARTATGEVRSLVGCATNLLEDPAVMGTVIVIHDITDRVALENQLRHQALHDALTGLPNRALIHDRLAQLLAAARRRASSVAVLFVDLDNFKDVNDSLGHALGDQLLQAVAGRLETVVRGEDTVGRLGGDEFVVLAERRPGAETAELLAQRILDLMDEPIVLDDLPDHGLFARVSIGIAVGTSEAPEELLRDADVALYRAKASGKNCLVVFEPGMHRLAEERLQLEVDLREALPRGEFFIVYQPIVDLERLVPFGVEALLRWHRPSEGVVLPAQFVPLLEDGRLIGPVGRWVLHEVCAQGAEWQRQGTPLSIGVNVSASQINSERFAHDVTDALASSGLDPSLLVLEITESVLIRDAAGAVGRIQQLKSLGVRVAIDDFGTGYSSFSYLRQLPVDVLKIDRSFVAEMGASKEAATLVHMLVSLGRELGLETLAEGIQDASELASLRAEECDSGQGFWIAEPMAADHVQAFIASWLRGTRPCAGHRSRHVIRQWSLTSAPAMVSSLC